MEPTEPITIRTAKNIVREIDSLAATIDRSRNYIVNQALKQYLEANAWQLSRINEGIAAARKGQVEPGEEVFAKIAGKHGWTK